MKKDKELFLPALKGRIGEWFFYTALMTFREVNERIKLSDELYSNKNLSDMVQRTVRTDRAKKIANYLRTERERFFPAMVVAVFEGAPNWVEFSIKGGGPKKNIDLSQLDSSKLESFGFLVFSGTENLFPLDGQHRLAGIREALSQPGADDQYLEDDEITVMFVAHAPNDIGRTRSRRLFTVLNKRAVSVKKHETIALDEDDIMAISTRHLVENFSPLSKQGLVSFRSSANIPSDDQTTFTTIVTIYDILFRLFRVLSNRKMEQLKFNRPNEEWLNVYLACAESFFEQLFDTFPVVKKCVHSQFPEITIAQNRAENGGHILFRPVGLNIISELIAAHLSTFWDQTFEESRDDPQVIKNLALESIKCSFREFKNLPTDLTQPPYADLIWNTETNKIVVSRASLVRDIILNKHNLLSASDTKKLRQRLKKSLGEKHNLSDLI